MKGRRKHGRWEERRITPIRISMAYSEFMQGNGTYLHFHRDKARYDEARTVHKANICCPKKRLEVFRLD
jgi:hypothetical protein